MRELTTKHFRLADGERVPAPKANGKVTIKWLEKFGTQKSSGMEIDLR